MARAEQRPGSPGNRTTLAWQRTALSLVTASAIVARLGYDRVGPLAPLSLVVLVPLGAAVLVLAGGAAGRPGSGRGVVAALLATAVALVAVTELVALVAEDQP
jgi:uncharacterized membrane protein YidH (DUF202 family)